MKARRRGKRREILRSAQNDEAVLEIARRLGDGLGDGFFPAALGFQDQFY
jgi:hypothetical protein